MVTKALTASRDGKWKGAAFQARLSIRPESDDILIGRLSQAQYAKVQTTTSNVNNNDLDYNDVPLEEPFKIKLKNGIVDALFVNRDLTENQIKPLKFVVNAVLNQFQVDSNIQYQMNGENAFYRKNERTAVGDCETVYEISPLPEYLAQSSRDLVPLPELQRQGQFFDVVKTRNYNNCNRRTGSNLLKNAPSLTEVNRIILSGSLNDYTVQTSVRTVKVADSLNAPPKTISHVNVILESIDTNAKFAPWIDFDNLKNVESINNSPSDTQNRARPSYESKNRARSFGSYEIENRDRTRGSYETENRGRPMGSYESRQG